MSGSRKKKKRNNNYSKNKKRAELQREVVKEQLDEYQAGELQDIVIEDFEELEATEENVMVETATDEPVVVTESIETSEEAEEGAEIEFEEVEFEETTEETEEVAEVEESVEETETPEEVVTEEEIEAVEEAEPAETEEMVEDSVMEDVAAVSDNRPKRKIWKKLLLIPAVLIAIAIVSIVTIFVYEKAFIYTVCRVEAGIEVTADEFLKKERVYFTDASDEFDTTIPGEYELVINVGLFNNRCKLIVEDTTAPVVNLVPLTIEYGNTCEVNDFIESIEDVTQTTVAYETEPDYLYKGEQAVKIVVTDAAGNSTVAETTLMISSVVSELNVEIGGSAPAVSDFVISGDNAQIVTDINSIDYSVLGVHKVEVDVDGITYEVTMNIVDTVAPVIEVQDISGFSLVPRNAQDFVVSGEDATELTYSFETEPDLTLTGEQNLVVIATDQGGNQAYGNVKLTLEADTQAPVITQAGDMIVIIGNSISYKSNIKAEDNCPEGLDILVDSSAVNLNAVGTYPVTYTAKDLAGNETSVTVNLTVKEQTYDIETVNALCDQVLAQIITDGMSQRDKAQAIFNYTRSHVSYISHSEKGDYVRAAYEGLADGKGDCYVFACVSKVLLTRAGITNMDIEKIRINGTMHFWNLVDIGDGWGWYHYDATPRKDGTKFFLWTDTPLREYSDSHNDSHNYDPALYPTINP